MLLNSLGSTGCMKKVNCIMFWFVFIKDVLIKFLEFVCELSIDSKKC